MKYWLGFLLFTLSLQPAWADLQCKDYRGIKVSTIYTTKIADGATARHTRHGHPVILANTNILKGFSSVMTRFVYAHECAHHVLGHLKNKVSNVEFEQEADCWAAQTLVDNQYFDTNDIRKVQLMIRLYGIDDATL